MSHYNGCGCGGGCNSCTSHNEIQQAVNDALAFEKENLEQYENNAAQSATDAAKEAAKAAESASAAAQSQTNAETAAGTATQAASSVTNTAVVLEETAERIEQAQDLLEEQISALQTKPVYFEVSSPTNTLVLPESEAVFNVRSIYVASARQSLGYGFTFDKETRTVTLAEEITAEQITETEVGYILVEVICDVYSSDDPTSFPIILASPAGASNVGTLAGITVESALTHSKANDREQWRRQLADVGFTLVDGSFEEGATLENASDAIWHMAGGKCYTWSGTLPKVIGSNSTPLGDESIGWNSVDLLLSSPTGGNLIRIDNAKLSDVAEVSILRFMTPADINTILNTSGAEVAVDYALQSVIDAGYKSVRFSHHVKGIYTLNGSVTLPGGFTIYGECSKPYTITDDSSFVGKGTVIRKASGADYIFGPGSAFRIYGCILDGRDKLRPLINQTNQVRGGILFNCGIYRFLYGAGSYSYTSIQVGKSSLCANQDGIYNLIDSRIIDTTINANSRHGVNLQAGANNNLFQNVRNEWNEGIGYNISGSVGNIITGELVDRSGSANFAITNGGGAVLGDLFSQRPGKNSAVGSTYNTHFYIEGSGSYLMLSNVKTRTGVDDGGGGNLTPERVITTGGTATDVTIHATGCDLTGYTVAALREVVTIDNKLFRNNTGVSDTVTTGLYQMTTGRQNIGGAKTNQILSSGAGSTLTLTFSHPALVDPTSNPTPRPKRRTILIESNTSAGVVNTYEIGILIRRVSATAAVATLSGKEFSSPTGVWGVSGATGVTVAVSVNADASTITVQLTNVDGVGRFVDVTLLPQ